jgi:pimeloyl-ACP methyl ester carboxylesterase
MNDQHVPVPGGELYVRRWPVDSEAVAPIVLLHDSLGSVDQWRDFPEALAQATRRTVIAYDRLGFGRSTPRLEPASPRFIDEEAEVYFPALCEGLGLDRVVLFGHSVGGGMALTIAARHPDACAAVISESAQAFVEERTREGIRAAQRAFADPAQFARLERWHGARAAWVNAAWADNWLSPAFDGWSLDAVLPRVTCPVLAIHGDRDEFGSLAFPRRIAERVSGRAERMLIEDCGHIPHRERRDEVLARVAVFLTPG